eukprot:2733594-Ditylum_brightwellii.AAC.1
MQYKELREAIFWTDKIETSSSDEPAVHMYQPGGKMIGAVGKIQGRVITATNDPHGLGRWSMVCLTGEATKVYIVSAY